MIFTDWVILYVVIGLVVGFFVIRFNIDKGHVTNPEKIEKYVLLATLFFVLAWPLFFFFVVYLMWKKGKEERENQDNNK